MSRPAVQKQKLQQQTTTTVAPEPKKVKRSMMLKAHNSWKNNEKFFELDELEQAKQWIIDQCIEDKMESSPGYYFVYRIATDGSEPYVMFTLTEKAIVFMNNERTMKQLQSAIAGDNSVIGISDITLQKILEYLETNKLKLKLEKQTDSDDSDSDSID